MKTPRDEPYRPPESGRREPEIDPLSSPMFRIEPAHKRAVTPVVMTMVVLVLWTLASALTFRYGSRMVLVKVEGRVLSEQGRPLPGEELSLSLSPYYGYASWNEEDASKPAEEVSVTTDESGRFEATLGRAAYCVQLLTLPPVEIPSRPPPLSFTMVFTNDPEHRYRVRVLERDYVVEVDGEGLSPGRYALSVREDLQFGPRVATGVVEASFRGSGEPGIRQSSLPSRSRR